jgi:hypothetical protein
MANRIRDIFATDGSVFLVFNKPGGQFHRAVVQAPA